MASIARIKANWTGFPGAPGVSVFHFSTFEGNFGPGVQGAAGAVATFFSSIANFLPASVRIDIDPEAEILEDSTGELIDTSPIDGIGQIPGVSTQAYSGPTGAVVNWRTGSIRNGRRMRGRTFIVPLSGDSFQNDGTINPTVLNALNSSVDTFLGTADVALQVYGRPTILGTDGVSADVTSGTVPDLAAVLRSRRG